VLSKYLGHIDLGKIRFVLFDNVIKLSECLTKHPAHLVIYSFNIFLRGTLYHSPVYLVNALNQRVRYLLSYGQRSFLLPLDLLFFGLCLGRYLFSELTLRHLFIFLLRVRHRVVHIVYHRFMILPASVSFILSC
jgi:hypothetical protein